MIIFDGIITGKTEDFFWHKKSQKENLILLICEICFLMSIPALYKIIGLTRSLIIILPVFFFLFFVSITVPKNKKKSEAKKLLPFKIIIDEENITYHDTNQTESKKIQEIEKIHDCGEYYYISFDEVENVFVCQKDLIIHGTIKEFEELFSDRIISK